MTEFKVGDTVRITCAKGRGETFVVELIDEDGDLWGGEWCYSAHDVELAEDRTNWHPHADVIIAWAKGEKIQHKHNGSGPWLETPSAIHCEVVQQCCFFNENEYRIKPDNSEEIDRIKQEIQTHGKAIDELQARLKELEQ